VFAALLKQCSIELHHGPGWSKLHRICLLGALCMM
jgi:hypothetical protein